MRPVFSILLLVVPVVVLCCDETTHYKKDGECCKMCGPGTRMKQDTNCHDPFCQECKEGEYQDGYTKETKCKLQPSCDTNLNFEVPSQQSKTTRQPCVCHPGYHCSSQDCVSCVLNTVCHPGQKIASEGDRTFDTTCESCPAGTYSTESSAKHCKQWTGCTFGYVEAAAGTSKTDRICEPQSNVRLGLGIFAGLFIFIVIVVVVLCCYRRGRSGSKCLTEKLQQHCPALFKVTVTEPAVVVPMQPEETGLNEPQEDNEDTDRHDEKKYGLSANGMPIDQDHSKTSILSVSETQPSSQSYTDRL